MAIIAADFKVEYPEFAGTPNALVTAALTRATALTNSAVFQTAALFEHAVFLRAAITLHESPHGRAMRKDDPGVLAFAYREQLRDAQKAATFGLRVVGNIP